MEDVLKWLNSPMGALVSFYIFSSFVQALPEPKENGPMWYKFLHDLVHILGANWKVIGKRG